MTLLRPGFHASPASGLTLILGLLLMTACSGVGIGSASLPQPTVHWKVQLQKTSGFAQYPRNPAGPVSAAQGRVILAGTALDPEKTLVHALRADSGEILWQLPISGPLMASPAVAENLGVLATANGLVYLVDLPSGKVIWSKPTQLNSALVSQPLLLPDRGLILIHESSGSLTALDNASGEVLWSTPSRMPLGPSLQGNSSPTLHGGYALSGEANGTVRAVSLKDGSQIWSTEICDSKTDLADSDLSPLVLEDGTVLAGCYSGQTAVLNPSDGTILKRFEPVGTRYALEDQGSLFLATRSSEVMMLKPGSFKPVWSTHTGRPATGELRTCGGYLLVPNDESLLLLDRATGAPMQQIQTVHGVSAPALCLDGDVFVITDDGSLYRTTLPR